METARRTGLHALLREALAPWRAGRFVHDPGKILLDLALAVALGGDRAADIAVLRAEPALFGPVASDPTVSRLIDALATAGPKALDAIRAARATGLRNLPFHDSAQNQIWLEIVQLALDLLSWMPMLALDAPARRWEPKTLRYRLLHTAARLTHGGRVTRLRFPRHWPWAQLITTALARLHALPNPG